jgi:hypothetical protein
MLTEIDYILAAPPVKRLRAVVKKEVLIETGCNWFAWCPHNVLDYIEIYQLSA